MTIDEQIEILKAVKEWKKIEVSVDDGQTWYPKDGHEFNFGLCLYRIVREPRRFTIFKWKTAVYAIPYGEHVPGDAKIICTAVEEENLKTVDVAKWAEKEAEKIEARMLA